MKKFLLTPLKQWTVLHFMAIISALALLFSLCTNKITFEQFAQVSSQNLEKYERIVDNTETPNGTIHIEPSISE